MTARIRRVEARDLAELVTLCAEHAAYENAAYRDDGQAERLAAALFGAAPVLFGWVAEDDGALVGFMTATRDFATWDARFFLHMDCLFLRPGWRGRGIGRALVAELQAFARSEGVGLIQWQTPAGNAVGIAFYEAIGARAKPKQRYFLDVAPGAAAAPDAKENGT